MNKAGPVALFWFRRDLRLADNAGLYQALSSGLPVLPIFIYDINILSDLEDKADRRVCFIRDNLAGLRASLLDRGSTLLVLHGDPLFIFEGLLRDWDIKALYTNEDYEPFARSRDQAVAALMQSRGIPFHSFKDQLIFRPGEVLKDDGSPYTVFTPFGRKWLHLFGETSLKTFPSETLQDRFLKTAPGSFPDLAEIGFQEIAYEAPPRFPDEQVLISYDKTRDLPARNGTLNLSVHLRFGTISIRQVAAAVSALNQTALKELIWREFFSSVLWYFPHTVSDAFKAAYDNIRWSSSEQEFKLWCEGRTGYPIVDAGMRQLQETGWMHNRARMITASFLCKHLLIDWRWGEAWFARKLMDYDLAQNSGNWQWVAGCGVDAAPYFRIFNPLRQQEKFDKNLDYVRRWVPEYGTAAYPPPMVDHEAARERCLAAYKAALQQQK